LRCCVITLAIILAPGVRGDILIAQHAGEQQFANEVTHMPDFDQKRLDVPGVVVGFPEAGGMYCVPTATVNLFAYIANHGFPEVAPGPGNWRSDALYNAAGSYIT
jgi:hypothetical protein